MAQVQVNKKFNLQLNDFTRGLLVAVGTAVFAFLLPVISDVATGQAENFEFKWKQLLAIALYSFLGYIVKNLFTPTEVVVKNPTPAAVDSLKAGDSTVQVVQNNTGNTLSTAVPTTTTATKP